MAEVQLTLTAQDEATPTIQQVQQAMQGAGATAEQTTNYFAALGLSEQELAPATAQAAQALAAEAQAAQAAGASTQQAAQSLQNTTPPLLSVTQAAVGTSQATADAGKGFGDLIVQGALMATGFGSVLAIMSSLRSGILDSVTAASDYQVALTNVEIVTRNSAEAQAAFSAHIQALPSILGSATSLANDFALAYRSLQDSAQALQVTEASARLAAAAQSDLQSTTKTVLEVMHQYGLEADQAAHISDVLFTTQTRGVGTMGEFGQAIGTVLPLAQHFGVSLEDVTATMETLSVALNSPQAAGQALQGLFRALITHAADFAAAGIDVKTALGEGGIEGLVRAIAPLLNGHDEQLKTLFGSYRNFNAIIELTGPLLQRLTEDHRAAGDSAGAAADALDKRSKDLATSWQALKNEAGTLIGGALQPLVGYLAEDLAAVNAFIAGNASLHAGAEQTTMKLRDVGGAAESLGGAGSGLLVALKGTTDAASAAMAGQSKEVQALAAQYPQLAGVLGTFREQQAREGIGFENTSAAAQDLQKGLHALASQPLDASAVQTYTTTAIAALNYLAASGQSSFTILDKNAEQLITDVLKRTGTIPPAVSDMYRQVMASGEGTASQVEASLGRVMQEMLTMTGSISPAMIQMFRDVIGRADASGQDMVRIWQAVADKQRAITGALSPEMRALYQDIVDKQITELQRLAGSHQITYDEVLKRTKTLADGMKATMGEVSPKVQADIDRLRDGIGTSMGQAGQAVTTFSVTTDAAGNKVVTNVNAMTDAATKGTVVWGGGLRQLTIAYDEFGNKILVVADQVDDAMRRHQVAINNATLQIRQQFDLSAQSGNTAIQAIEHQILGLPDVSVTAFRQFGETGRVTFEQLLAHGNLSASEITKGMGQMAANIEHSSFEVLPPAWEGSLQRMNAQAETSGAALVQTFRNSAGLITPVLNNMVGQVDQQFATLALQTTANAGRVGDAWARDFANIQSQGGVTQERLVAFAQQAAQQMISQFGTLPSAMQPIMDSLGIDWQAMCDKMTQKAHDTVGSIKQQFDLLSQSAAGFLKGEGSSSSHPLTAQGNTLEELQKELIAAQALLHTTTGIEASFYADKTVLPYISSIEEKIAELKKQQLSSSQSINDTQAKSLQNGAAQLAQESDLAQMYRQGQEARAQASIDAREKQLKVLQDSLQTAQDEISSSTTYQQQQRDGLARQIQALNEQKNQYATSLGQLKTQEDQLKSQQDQLVAQQHQLEIQRSQKDITTEQKAEYDKQIADIKTQVTQLEDQKKALQDQANITQAQSRELDNQLRTLQEQDKQLQIQIKTMADNLAQEKQITAEKEKQLSLEEDTFKATLARLQAGASGSAYGGAGGSGPSGGGGGGGSGPAPPAQSSAHTINVNAPVTVNAPLSTVTRADTQTLVNALVPAINEAIRRGQIMLPRGGA